MRFIGTCAHMREVLWEAWATYVTVAMCTPQKHGIIKYILLETVTKQAQFR
jgi:hypothetical protein